jgi:hypothetical protein
MTEAATGPEKKNLSPLAWVGIGCAALLLFAFVVFGAATFFVAGKAKEFIDEAGDNPTAVAAETFVRLNPELELVSSDRDAGTLVARDKNSGEELSFSYEDLEQGRFSFTTGDGERVDVDASNAIDGGDGTIVTIETEDGTTRMGTLGSGMELPSWMPAYPGASVEEGGFASVQEDRANGSFTLSSADDPARVADFYQGVFDDLGLETTRSQTDVGNGPIVSLSARGDAYVVGVMVATAEEGSQAHVTYQGPR